MPELLRGVWIRIYFDGEEKPSVNTPLGDFSGVGFGEYKHYQSRYLMMTSGGYVRQFHMPFQQSARVVVVNTNETLLVPAIYGAVTYLIYPDDELLAQQAYLHAQYREERPTSRGRPYLVLDTRTMGLPDRPGHFVGVVLNTEATRRQAGFAYLEGNPRIWVDDESENH